MSQSSSATLKRDPLQNLMRSISEIGFNIESQSPTEFGSQYFDIFLRLSGLRHRGDIAGVARGFRQRRHGLGAALGVLNVARVHRQAGGFEAPLDGAVQSGEVHIGRAAPERCVS